jgi:hypothetical protein
MGRHCDRWSERPLWVEPPRSMARVGTSGIGALPPFTRTGAKGRSPPRAVLRSEYPSVRFDPLGRPSRLQPYAETGPAARGGGWARGAGSGWRRASVAGPGEGAVAGRQRGLRAQKSVRVRYARGPISPGAGRSVPCRHFGPAAPRAPQPRPPVEGRWSVCGGTVALGDGRCRRATFIRTRTAEGRSRAQKRGQHMGRPLKLTAAQPLQAVCAGECHGVAAEELAFRSRQRPCYRRAEHG